MARFWLDFDIRERALALVCSDLLKQNILLNIYHNINNIY